MLSAMHGYGKTFKRGTDYFYLEHLGFISQRNAPANILY